MTTKNTDQVHFTKSFMFIRCPGSEYEIPMAALDNVQKKNDVIKWLSEKSWFTVAMRTEINNVLQERYGIV